MNYIKTLNGIFNYDDIESNVLDVESIAHSLSLQCRYGGHVPVMYSVANHTLGMVDQYVGDNGLMDASLITLDHILVMKQMMMHDAGEAYLTDLMRPIKRLMPEYMEVEKRVDAHIFNFFGLGEKLDIVKEYDNRILADEMISFWGESYVDFEPFGRKVEGDPADFRILKQGFIVTWNAIIEKEKELKNV